MAEKLLDRQISEMEKDLQEGQSRSKEKRAPLTSPDLESDRRTLDALKETREEARKASPEYQAQEAAKQNERYKRSLERQEAFWQTRLEEAKQGKLPEKRKPTPVDNAILEKKYEIEKVKREVR